MAVNEELAEAGIAPIDIIVPVTSDRQRYVLRDELKDEPGASRILLDETTGEILGDTLRSQSNFGEHLKTLRYGFESTQSSLNQRLGKDATAELELHTLDGTPVTVDPTGIIGSLDTGGRVALDTPNRDFAFPVLNSELVDAAHAAGLPFDASDMLAVAAKSRSAELGYRIRFIPLVHTLAGMALSESPEATIPERFKELEIQTTETPAGEITFTPPMKNVPIAEQFDGVDGPGIYAMLSGTDNGAADTFAATLNAAKGAYLGVYTNPWAAETEGLKRISPKALNDPRIQTVVSRAGWGTGWQMLNHGKPWLVIPPHETDDPEILFNHDVIEKLGIGKVIDPETFTADALTKYISACGPRVRDLRDLTAEKFGTSDGIKYIAKKIADEYKKTGLLLTNAATQ